MPMKRLSVIGGILLGLLSLTTATAPPHPLHCLPASSIISTNLACSPSRTGDLASPINKPSHILIDKKETDPIQFYPWSYRPFCYKNPELELCVYTNVSFASGRGISILTTPKIAKEFAALLPFQDPTALQGINGHGHTDPLYLSLVPGKGTGALASRDLARGELITAYTPLLLSYREDIISTSDREALLRRAVNQLPKKSSEMYYNLAKIYNVESVKAQDVLKANTFGIEVGGWEHLAIWPETARINHACGPNSQYRIVGSSLTHFVHAARPISKDEEITITYTNPFNTYQQRQRDLASAFHFACTCSRCLASSDSDSALQRITALQNLLSDWGFSPSRAPTIKDAEALISLYKDEGLDGFLDIPYGHAAMMYSAAGEKEGVVKYAKLAKEAVGLKEGEGIGDWGFWGRFADGVEEHWSWKRRVGRN